jgi:hypothetical protein
MKISKHLEQAVDFLNCQYSGTFTLEPINYRAQGVRIKRLGYDITHDSNAVKIRIEPCQFRESSVYGRDKYLVGISGRDYSQTAFFYATSLQAIRGYIEEKFCNQN